MHLDLLLGPPPVTTIEAGLIGTGEFGRKFLSQGRRVPGVKARVACDRDVSRAVAAFQVIGIDPADFSVCESHSAAMVAFESGAPGPVMAAANWRLMPWLAMIQARTLLPAGKEAGAYGREIESSEDAAKLEKMEAAVLAFC